MDDLINSLRGGWPHYYSLTPPLLSKMTAKNRESERLCARGFYVKNLSWNRWYSAVFFCFSSCPYLWCLIFRPMNIKKEAPTRKRPQTISRRIPWSLSVMYVPIMMMDTPMIYSPYPNDLTMMYTYHFNARHAQLNKLIFLRRRSKQLWIIKTETPSVAYIIEITF